MDIESTIETIGATLETVAAALPEELTQLLPQRLSFSPMGLDLSHIAKFLLFFAAGSLILSILGRFILGKRSSLNHSLSSVMAILFIYAVTIMVYTFQPWNLKNYLSPLPFVTFFNDYMVVMPIIGVFPTILARELVSLIILAFLVNFLDWIVPQGKTILGWYCLRFFTVGLAMAVHLVIHWAFNTYLPNFLVQYAPLVLLLLLVALLLLGFLNAVLGLILTITNPFVGAVYTFFFSTLVGKQVTKGVFTSLVLCVILLLIDRFGYSFIEINMTALTAYGPLAIVSLILWYLIGHVL